MSGGEALITAFSSGEPTFQFVVCIKL
jgi:hypothetical protein